MDTRETVSAKDAMEGVRALNEMMGLFKQSEAVLGKLLPKFLEACEGNGVAMFEGMAQVADLDVDDAQGALIVALTVISKIKAKAKGTPAEEILREIFHPEEP